MDLVERGAVQCFGALSRHCSSVLPGVPNMNPKQIGTGLMHGISQTA